MRRLALLAALAAALAVPAAAAASPYIRYGVQDDAWLEYGPGTLADRLDRLQSFGVAVVRVTVDWRATEPRPGVYDWSRADALLAGLHSRGIAPLVTLYGSPAWANGGLAENWAPRTTTSFAAFARRIAARYPYVHLWAIWNEPNQRRWLRPTTPSTYVQKLLNPAYAAIHAVSPGSLVAGGVTAPRGATGGVSPVAFIAGMAKAHARLDAYAHNPYPLSPAETPFTGGCTHCTTLTMATLPELIADVGRDFGPSTRIWLTEYGYQTDPPDPYLGVSWAKQALYVSEAGLRAYLAPRVDLLVNFLVEDEPEISRWQSGFLTADGVEKPSYQAFQLPLAVEARHGDTITLWGQIRPGSGVQTYQLQERTGGRWLDVGGPARTGRRGFFTRVVAAGAGAAFRVVQLTRGLTSATVTG